MVIGGRVWNGKLFRVYESVRLLLVPTPELLASCIVVCRPCLGSTCGTLKYSVCENVNDGRSYVWVALAASETTPSVMGGWLLLVSEVQRIVDVPLSTVPVFFTVTRASAD